jgi:hypothetical protein
MGPPGHGRQLDADWVLTHTLAGCPRSVRGRGASIPDPELHATMSTRRLLPLLPWLLGFFLVANVYLVPTRTQSPRALDLLGLGLGLWLILRLFSGGARTQPLMVLAFLNLVPLCWGLYAYQEGLRATMLMSGRWLLAMPVGYALFHTAAQKDLRARLLWGPSTPRCWSCSMLAWRR